jgi:predicted double-glycine peptidase
MTMQYFRLLTRTRQSTDYSCGASALQAVLSYWGKEIEELELMKLLNTNSDVGTYPENIVHGARSLGFRAHMKDHVSLDEVRRFTADGKPAIALAQVWRSYRDSSASPADEWDSGHYIVILGVDEEYVYFQDPFIRMSKAFVPRKSFEEHWHHAMGGDRENNPKLINLVIYVEGDAPAESPPAPTRDAAALDLAQVASLNLIVLEFDKPLLPYDFLKELSPIWKSGDVRPDAFVFLRKDAEGSLSGLEGSQLVDEDDMAAINAVIAAIVSAGVSNPDTVRSRVQTAIREVAAGDFGLSALDIRRIGESLRPGTSALAVLIENVWERTLKQVTSRYSGTIKRQQLVSSETVVAAARNLAAESAGHARP